MFLCRIIAWLHSRMDGCMIEIGRWEIFFICWRFRICVLTPTPRLPLSRGIRRSTGRILVVPKTEQWLKQCLWEYTFQLFCFKCILFEILKGTCEVTAQPCGCWLWSKKGKNYGTYSLCRWYCGNGSERKSPPIFFPMDATRFQISNDTLNDTYSSSVVL